MIVALNLAAEPEATAAEQRSSVGPGGKTIAGIQILLHGIVLLKLKRQKHSMTRDFQTSTRRY